MKRIKIAAAGTAALTAVIFFVCACRSTESKKPSTVNSTEFVKNNGQNIDNTTPTNNSSQPESTDLPTEPLEVTPLFDDPSSYLKYDASTDTYILPEEEETLGENSLFVGDSICSGFSAWEVLKSKNVYATGNVGARNLFSYRMYYQREPAELVPVLKKTEPRYVFFWMGMNDVNLTSAEEYCENYSNIIFTTLENSDADVYVCAITPVSNLEFTRLAYINEFNDSIKNYIRTHCSERVHFVDFTEPLKAADGTLNEKYNGGDGIHLGREAYYIALHEINKQIKTE